MATKALQSIKFPGLSDTYTVPQVDNTLTTSGAAADAKKTGDEISDIKQDLEQIPSGTYENMTVGNAEQLVSSQYVEDEVPYLHRTTGGSADVGNRAYIDAITGVSIPWNQLYDKTYPTSKTIRGVTFTANQDGTIVVDGTADGTESIYYQLTTPMSFLNHKFLLMGCPPNGGPRTYRIYMDAHGASYDVGSGTVFTQTTADKAFYIYIDKTYNTTFNNAIFKPQVFDLTQMFGSTIADYIYTLENTTAGAGIAKLRSWGFFTDDYYAYNAGELKHVSGLVSHDTVGFNQWDEEWESGYYGDDGTPQTSNNYIRCKNYIPVLPNTTYYAKTNGTNMYVCQYDSDYAFIARNGYADTTFTTNANCKYIRFSMASGYGTTYNHDIAISLSWSGWRNGEYEAYVKHSYALDSDLVLRGIPKLDAQNNLYYDGDTYEPDGTVTRKYGIVDLGTLDWNYSEADVAFYSVSLSSLKKRTNTNIICSKYPNPYTSNTSLVSMADKTIQSRSDNDGLYIKDTAYTDAATFKTAMSGVYLVYELATETTETADAYTTPQIVDDFGTEEFVTTGVLPIGHTTRYPANLRDKIQHLPDLADSDGYYMINQTDKQMSLELFRIPKAPTTDGTYTLQASVSSGTPTYTWVSTT